MLLKYKNQKEEMGGKEELNNLRSAPLRLKRSFPGITSEFRMM